MRSGQLVCRWCAAPIPDDEFAQQGRANCLQKRLPNNNPKLVGFHIEEDPTALTPGLATTADVQTIELGPGSLVRADAGSLLGFQPVFTVDTVEKYQVVSFDIETSKIILLNRIEDIACNWYSTRGDVSNNLTALQFGPSLSMTWQLPTDALPGERDSLIVVVLDQRGGTDVGEVTVEYR